MKQTRSAHAHQLQVRSVGPRMALSRVAEILEWSNSIRESDTRLLIQAVCLDVIALLEEPPYPAQQGLSGNGDS